MDYPLPGCCIVCERTNRWAVALRRAMPEAPLRETRTLDECRAELDLAPAGVVALELTAAKADETADFVTEVVRRYPSARVAVLADRGLGEHEWLLRELGAVAWTDSPRELAAIVEVARRHLASAVAPRPGLREQMLARLPWG